jgi:hypothetical protein
MDSFLNRLEDALRQYGFVRKENKFEVRGTDRDTHISTTFFWDVDFVDGLPVVIPRKYSGDSFIHPADVGSSIGLSHSQKAVEGLVSEFIREKSLKAVRDAETKEPEKRGPSKALVGEQLQETVFVEKEVIDNKTISTLDKLKAELLKRKDLLDKKLLDEEKNLCLCIERKREHENRIEAIKDKILDLNSFLILAEVK